MRSKNVCIAILLFVTLLLSGCVSKSSFDKAQSDLTTAQQSLTAATADRDAAKTQLSRVQSDLTTAQQSLTAATTDRDAARAQLSRAQSDLTTAQQSLTTATTDRDAARAQLSKAQTDLTNTQQSQAALNTSVKKAQPYVDIARGYLNMAIAGMNKSSTDASTALSQIVLGLSAANDTELNSAWDAFMANPNTIANQIPFIKLLTQRLNDNKPKTN